MVIPGLLAGSLLGSLPAAAQFHQSPPLAKFIQELRGVGPGAIPVAVPDGLRHFSNGTTADHYTIDMNQYQDTLHPQLGKTTLWGYNPRTALGVTGIPVQKHLGGIIVAKRGRPVQITFHNNLPNRNLMPVDHSIMGAEVGQDENRTAIHLHGGLTSWFSDGTPFTDWSPSGFKAISCIGNQVLRPHEKVPKSEVDYFYTNEQSARLEWYHDHALGITRLNAYAGLASAFLIRDDFEANIMVKLLGLPDFIENGGRELPLVFQDKIFQNANDPRRHLAGTHQQAGEMWYPYQYDPNRWTVGPTGTPPAVSNIPEMFGDTMLVNGTAYPKATVDPRHYRLRILNACQARFLNLQLYEDDGTGSPDFTKPGPPWTVIGTEGGFLARPVNVPSGVPIIAQDDGAGNRTVDPTAPGGSLITAPAERWDLVVDFNGRAGKKYILWNDAPAPFPGGDGLNDYPVNGIGGGDVQRIMRFEVRAESKAIAKDPLFLLQTWMPLAGDPLARIDPPLAGPVANYPELFNSWLTASTAPLPIPTRPGIKVRKLTLNEIFDANGRLIQMLGTNEATATGDFSRPYAAPMDPNSLSTENVKAGTTEVWQIANTTGDTHPIHIHLVNFQILSRRPFDFNAYAATPKGQTANPVFTGPARGPEATELGWKETVKMHPGEVTTLIMKFNLPKLPFLVPNSPRTGGLEYVWHCHILEHEEHDMMRPLIVTP